MHRNTPGASRPPNRASATGAGWASGAAAVLVSLLLLAPPIGQASVAADAPRCDLSESGRRWIQGALDGWERVSIEVLELDSVPRPWMVFFDRSCAWHLWPDTSRLPGAEPSGADLSLAGSPVPNRVRPHADALWLPNGSSIPVREMAAAFPYASGSGRTEAGFVLALPEVWREKRPAAEHPHLEAEIMGVASHELVHTLQLPHVVGRVEELESRYEVPDDLGDDVVEERFGGTPAFREAYEAETDLFYRAVSEQDESRARELAARALERVRAREARFFTGDDAVYRELDPLFLNMEGTAVWAAYRLSRTDPEYDIGIDDPAEDRRRNSWSQDRGLALFLLVDRWVPGWRERVLGPELASPYALLEKALGRRD